jgi:hypothetical protein
MIHFSGRSIDGQSQDYDYRLLSCHRLHFGSRISLAVQDADHGRRAGLNTCCISEVKCGITDPAGRARAEGEVIASNARSLPMNSVRQLSAIAAFSLFLQPSFVQKLVDPNTVAPEFRAAAEKRRAEQLTLNDCSKKANDAKILKRDRAAFIFGCAESKNQAATNGGVKQP